MDCHYKSSTSQGTQLLSFIMKHWKLVVPLLLLWLVGVLYLTTTVPAHSGNTELHLARALEELERLNQQNSELQVLMAKFSKDTGHDDPRGQARGSHGGGNAESAAELEMKELEERLIRANHDISMLEGNKPQKLKYETEHSRRKVENTARELWRFLNAQLKKMSEGQQMDVARVAKLRRDLEGYRRTMEDDFVKLRRANGAEEWRNKKSKELGSLVQRRLQYLQNPADCSKAKKVLCDLHKGCGFGCQIHHLTYCLITAYALGRTLVLDSHGWRYAPRGWESVFKPLSETCRTIGDDSKTRWGYNIVGLPTKKKKRRKKNRFGLELSPHDITTEMTTPSYQAFMTEMEKLPVIEMPIVDSLRPRPDFMPLAIPADLAPELTTFHGDPPVWWIGQMVQYLFRPNAITEKLIESSVKRLGFRNTIVGVHVRRTDKINLEAAYHSIEEYMVHVREFYDQLQRTRNVTRRVYLATDDSNLLKEAKRKYPDYKFISDSVISKSAGLGTRYSDSSLRGVILDIYMLSRCDFLVCTFSSQVCRVAYEIMQTLHGDASESFRSLDDVFYYGGQNAHDLRVLEDHKADRDGMIDVKVGDNVGIAGNHWDGFSKGNNRRSGTNGLYPSYKVENTVVTVNMPTYPEVPLDSS